MTLSQANLPQPSPELELRRCLDSLVLLFESSLPTKEQWFAALCKVPAHAWKFSLRRVGGCVQEEILIEYKTKATDFSLSAQFIENTQIGLEGQEKLSHSGQLGKINLNNFPQTIAAVISSIRPRLIENTKYIEDKAALVLKAQDFVRQEAWARSVLDQHLASPTCTHEGIARESAIKLANNALEKYRPPSEEGDHYEFQEMLACRVIANDKETVRLVSFDAFMLDIHGNEYPCTFLFVEVKPFPSSSCEPVELLFDQEFGPDYSRYISLINPAVNKS